MLIVELKLILQSVFPHVKHEQEKGIIRVKCVNLTFYQFVYISYVLFVGIEIEIKFTTL